MEKVITRAEGQIWRGLSVMIIALF